MTTECTTERLEFERFRRQRVVGRFDGGELGSDGGGLLLRELAQRTGPVLDAGERYKKIVADTARLDALLVDLFLDWHGEQPERIVGRIRKRWPGVEIWLRGDSGFCRDELLAWCEAQGVEYVLGIAQNPRLKRSLAPELERARQECERTGQAARVFKDFRYRTLDSWSCSPIAPRRRRCGPTSCACISPRSPTRCWSYCGAGACRARGWRGRNAARSA